MGKDTKTSAKAGKVQVSSKSVGAKKDTLRPAVTLKGTKDKAIKKAKMAGAAAKQGIQKRGSRKIRTSVHFFRPKTLKKKRSPIYERYCRIRVTPKLDAYSIIRYPTSSESTMQDVEKNNTLTLIVDSRANKYQIKLAVKQLWDVTCASVKTLNRSDGTKKAFVRLTPDCDAIDIAGRMGMV